MAQTNCGGIIRKGFLLQGESPKESDCIVVAPSVITQEFVNGLEAALEQFREIANDLGEKGESKQV